MTTTAAVRQPDDAAMGSASLTRAELLVRYRRLREIGKQHHSALLKFIAKDAVLSQARRLCLAKGKTLLLNSWEDMNLVFDLLIYTAPQHRTRGIDRYARATKFALESNEGLVVQAMQNARFSIITFTRRHPIAGLIVKDLYRGIECWLVDEGLEGSLPIGAVLATRLYSVDDFAMTTGISVPLDGELIMHVIADTPQLHRKKPEYVIDDFRFAEAIYRAAVVSGSVAQIVYQDTPTHPN
jgi:hypothetical protein